MTEQERREREAVMFQRGKESGRKELIEEFKVLFDLDSCSHCEHRHKEMD